MLLEWSRAIKVSLPIPLCVGDCPDRGYYSQQTLYFERKQARSANAFRTYSISATHGKVVRATPIVFLKEVG